MDDRQELRFTFGCEIRKDARFALTVEGVEPAYVGVVSDDRSHVLFSVKPSQVSYTAQLVVMVDNYFPNGGWIVQAHNIYIYPDVVRIQVDGEGKHLYWNA